MRSHQGEVEEQRQSGGLERRRGWRGGGTEGRRVDIWSLESTETLTSKEIEAQQHKELEN